MLKRLILEDWHPLLLLISFACAFGIFCFFTIRALRMKPAEVRRLAHLPLQPDSPPSSRPSDGNS